MFSLSKVGGGTLMNLMEKHTKRLNLYISYETYNELERIAISEGRKTGSLARNILDRWVENRIIHESKKEKNDEKVT